MRVDLLTREYPPETYGVAGTHVAELVRAMPSSVDVRVRCFGADRDDARVDAYRVPPHLAEANPALAAMGVDLEIASATAGADIVHSHTWYANLAGHLSSLLHGIPHVVTAHSLEPLRPWKAEQLGGGYRVSSWIEQTAMGHAHAIIAVGDGMARDIQRSYPFLDADKTHVIPHGVDATFWHSIDEPDTVRSLGVDPERPAVVFVDRISRREDLLYLLQAAVMLPSEVQLVLCTGLSATPEILDELRKDVAELRAHGGSVVWIEQKLSRVELRALLSSATAYVCPLVSDPFGVVTLEAMACGVPVVALNSGDLSAVVDHGVTGLLVPMGQERRGRAHSLNSELIIRNLAGSLNEMVADLMRARATGVAGRARVEREFAWERIAARTLEVYQSLR